MRCGASNDDIGIGSEKHSRLQVANEFSRIHSIQHNLGFPDLMGGFGEAERSKIHRYREDNCATLSNFQSISDHFWTISVLELTLQSQKRQCQMSRNAPKTSRNLRKFTNRRYEHCLLRYQGSWSKLLCPLQKLAHFHPSPWFAVFAAH